MKQETLEEAAKSNYEDKTARIPVPTSHWINSEFLQIQNFKEGAKWQAKRMYSAEEVLETLRQYALEEHLITSSKPDKWFEQFKK